MKRQKTPLVLHISAYVRVCGAAALTRLTAVALTLALGSQHLATNRLSTGVPCVQYSAAALVAATLTLSAMSLSIAQCSRQHKQLIYSQCRAEHQQPHQ
jgi:hypothetical protein